MTDSKTGTDDSMQLEQPRITAKIAGRSVYLVLRPYAVGYFFAALACDLLYFSTQGSTDRRLSMVEFGMISEWLLFTGLFLAVLSNIAAFVDFCGEPRFRELSDLGLYASGNILVVVLELCNLFTRLTHGSDDIMETGLIYSSSSVLVLFCIPSQDWNRMYR